MVGSSTLSGDAPRKLRMEEHAPGMGEVDRFDPGVGLSWYAGFMKEITIPESWPRKWDKVYNYGLDVAESMGQRRQLMLSVLGDRVFVKSVWSRGRGQAQDVREFRGRLKPESAFAIGATLHEETGRPVVVQVDQATATSARGRPRKPLRGSAHFSGGRVREIWLDVARR